MTNGHRVGNSPTSENPLKAASPESAEANVPEIVLSASVSTSKRAATAVPSARNHASSGVLETPFTVKTAFPDAAPLAE